MLDITRDLRWTWSPRATALFDALSPDGTPSASYNPIDLVNNASDEDVFRVAHRVELAAQELGRLREQQGPTRAEAGLLTVAPVAYFCAEFGLHESLPIYSGGLGVLAGDHLKSAADLGVPLVAVGLYYREGYFEQRLDAEGWQLEGYPPSEDARVPAAPLLTPGGERVRLEVHTRAGTLHAQVWEVRVGSVRLLLLDADVEENDDAGRATTARLYGGDDRIRILQELLLGVGGLRALEAAGIRPSVVHLNEGHCAFATLERARALIERTGMSFGEARELLIPSTVFTTHTPVPAGHDRFRPELIEECLGPLRDAMGLSHEELLSLGREPGHETFCMTVLALNMCDKANGVSNLHGRVSRRMWKGLYPGRRVTEVPIGHITNGVHLPTWMAAEMQDLLDTFLGRHWRTLPPTEGNWLAVEEIEPRALMHVRDMLRSRLVQQARLRVVREARARGESEQICDTLAGALDDTRLVIGFARRFATYKRADLLFDDLETLDSLVNDPERPISFVFAGKAHPRDKGGQVLLQRIHRASRDPRFLGKIIFLEGYDLGLGRLLVQGADVWLNNPRPPMEASGTSGQKAILNGGLHCSVLDGWWAEAFDGTNGFGISHPDSHRDPAIQDQRDRQELLRTLREELLPAFYERDADGIPQAWVQRIRASMRTLAWRFDARRMVQDYAMQTYVPAAGVGTSHLFG